MTPQADPEDESAPQKDADRTERDASDRTGTQAARPAPEDSAEIAEADSGSAD